MATGNGTSAAFMQADEEYPTLSCYRPLNPKYKQIRLLSFGFTSAELDDSQPLTLAIQTHSMAFAEHQHYHALSYCWGSPTEKRELLVDKERVLIRKGVVDFLCHLRKLWHRKRFFFWLDILCIDQNNIEERNEQVSIMDEIYGQALGVYAYMGPETLATQSLTGYITSKCNSVIKSDENLAKIFDYPKGLQFGAPVWLAGLEDLSLRPYFGRLWIIQEAVFAKNLTMIIDGQSIEWAQFMAAQMAAPSGASRLSVISGVEERLRAISHLRSEFGSLKNATAPLIMLLHWFIECKCRDPRDAVYALLAMSSDRERIRINYNEKPLAVWWEVFCLCFDPSRRTVGLYEQEANLALMGKLYQRMVSASKQLEEISQLSSAAQATTVQVAINSFRSPLTVNEKCFSTRCCKRPGYIQCRSPDCSCWTTDAHDRLCERRIWRWYEVELHDAVVFPWRKDQGNLPNGQQVQLVANCPITKKDILISPRPDSQVLFIARVSTSHDTKIAGQAWVTKSLDDESWSIKFQTDVASSIRFTDCTLLDFDVNTEKRLRDLYNGGEILELGLQQKYLSVGITTAIMLATEQADANRSVESTPNQFPSTLMKVFHGRQWKKEPRKNRGEGNEPISMDLSA